MSVARTDLFGFIARMKCFVGNCYDNDTLPPALAQAKRVRKDAGGERPRTAVVDRGYRGRNRIAGTEVLFLPPGSRF